jgi:hypothetical protein
MGPFLAPLNVALCYTFTDVLIVFSIFFEKLFLKGKLKKFGFVHEN